MHPSPNDFPWRKLSCARHGAAPRQALYNNAASGAKQESTWRIRHSRRAYVVNRDPLAPESVDPAAKRSVIDLGFAAESHALWDVGL